MIVTTAHFNRDIKQGFLTCLVASLDQTINMGAVFHISIGLIIIS